MTSETSIHLRRAARLSRVAAERAPDIEYDEIPEDIDVEDVPTIRDVANDIGNTLTTLAIIAELHDRDDGDDAAEMDVDWPIVQDSMHPGHIEIDIPSEEMMLTLSDEYAIAFAEDIIRIVKQRRDA